MSDAAIDEKHAHLGGDAGLLGPPTAPHEAVGPGRRRVYRGGQIYWSASTGAWEVHGAILDRYIAAGSAGGFLGFPLTDELQGARADTRVSRFEHGGIWWSPATGAKEVHGAILVKYLITGGDGGVLGLPVTDEIAHPPGRRSQFQGGVILWTSSTGAFEVHGAILERYNSLGGSASFLGFPISDETDTRGTGGATGKLSRFTGGTIYWSPGTGAWETHGAIRDLYERRGGPASELGFPTTNETVVSPQDVRYNAFQNGVIAWTAALGAVAICDLQLHLGWVRSGGIDDGIGDSSAELITYTTVRVDNTPLETNVRRPGGHAGTAFDINTNYAVRNVRPSTRFDFEVRADDWDRVSSNDYLGTFRRAFDIRNVWGLSEGNAGAVVGMPLSQKGGDANNLASVKLDYSVQPTRPSLVDPSKTFREQFWWSFDNFKTPKLTQQQYADTYRDVGHRTNWFEKAVHPWDSLFYLAYEGLAAKGNCFGMSLEGALARTSRSVYGEPVFRFSRDAGMVQTDNLRHGYQLGDSSFRWILAKLATLDAVRPKRVYENVRAALARGDWPLLSMFSLSTFNGHTVLAYECPPVASGQPLVIRVADPNNPFTAGGPLHPTTIQIDPAADTFQFVTPQGVKYQSARIVGDLLPGTLMLETPVSVVAGPPRTPFWEFAALLAAIGGVVVLAGDADAEQLTADGEALYTTQAGIRTFRPGGANGWMRLPLFDHREASPPQLFAKNGGTSSKLELALRGSRSGAYRQYLRTAREAILVDAATDAATVDTLRIRQHGTDTRVEIDTTGAAKSAMVGVGSLLDPGRGESFGAAVSVGLRRGRTAVVGSKGPTQGVFIRSASGGETEVIFERSRLGERERVAVIVPVGAEDEGVLVRPSDIASPLGEMEITRTSATGEPSGRRSTRVGSRPIRGGLAGPFDVPDIGRPR